MALRRYGRDRLARLRGNYPRTFELCRVGSGCDGWMALIVVEGKRRVFRSGLHVMCLRLCRRHMLLVGGGNLLGRRPRCRAAGTAVVAHVGGIVDHNGLVIDVVDLHVRDVVDGPVVEEIAVAPIAALVAGAGIAEAIRYAAVKADFRTPIAFVKGIGVVVPAPISRCP
jgi:hypothetical protein